MPLNMGQNEELPQVVEIDDSPQHNNYKPLMT